MLSFLIFFLRQTGEVLSGEEEGAFGWLMANDFHGEICGDPQKTVGSLDMGGDSAEIAFIPQDYSIMSHMLDLSLQVQVKPKRLSIVKKIRQNWLMLTPWHKSCKIPRNVLEKYLLH